MIGGLITSTLLTLFVVPVVYALLDDLINHVFRHGGARPATVHRPPPSRVLTD